MNDRTANPVLQHQCAVQVFDGIPCDMSEHNGLGCTGCVPYVHSDLSIDHEPGCTAVVVTLTTETVDG